MKTKLSWIIAAVALFSLSGVLVSPADAGVHVGIGINISPPPPVVLSAPPEVVYIPGSYVYYAPNAGVDILFYHGFWYRPYGERWFRARDYNGPWAFIDSRRVPGPVLNLPPDYRRLAVRDRIPYGQLRSNWRHWEKERHWDERRAEHRARAHAKEERRERRREEKREHRDRERY